MMSLDECLAKLRPLICGGDAGDREVAQEAMSGFVASHPGHEERSAAMLTLEGALTRETAGLSNTSLAFAFALIEWLDRERRALATPPGR